MLPCAPCRNRATFHAIARRIESPKGIYAPRDTSFRRLRQGAKPTDGNPKTHIATDTLNYYIGRTRSCQAFHRSCRGILHDNLHNRLRSRRTAPFRFGAQPTTAQKRIKDRFRRVLSAETTRYTRGRSDSPRDCTQRHKSAAASHILHAALPHPRYASSCSPRAPPHRRR